MWLYSLDVQGFSLYQQIAADIIIIDCGPRYSASCPFGFPLPHRYIVALQHLPFLTSLAIGNMPIVPYQLIEALAVLPALTELDLSEPRPPQLDGGGGGAGPGGGGGSGAAAAGAGGAAAAGWAAAAAAVAAAVAAKEPLRPFTVAALARMRNLKVLDLSR